MGLGAVGKPTPTPAPFPPKEANLDAFDRLNTFLGEQREGAKKPWLPKWSRNAARVLEHLKDRYYVPSIGDLAPPHYNGRNVIVAGSGPSLIGLPVSGLESSTLITSPTAVPYLMHRGVEPEVIAVADTNPLLHQILEPFRLELADTPILLPVIAHPIWIESPIGRPYWYKPLIQTTTGNPWDDPINVMLQEFFPHVSSHVTQAGCVTNVMIGVAHIWSMEWNLNRVVLVGCDYGFPIDSAYHRVPIAFGSRSELFEPEQLIGARPRHTLRNISTTLTDIGYAVATLSLAAESTFDVVLGSGPSLLEGYLPRYSVERWVESHGYIKRGDRYESIIGKIRDFAQEVEPILKGLEEEQARQEAEAEARAEAKD